eukprot:9397463-Alexandrium_andersonii.AAC.1
MSEWSILAAASAKSGQMPKRPFTPERYFPSFAQSFGKTELAGLQTHLLTMRSPSFEPQSAS